MTDGAIIIIATALCGLGYAAVIAYMLRGFK